MEFTKMICNRQNVLFLGRVLARKGGNDILDDYNRVCIIPPSKII